MSHILRPYFITVYWGYCEWKNDCVCIFFFFLCVRMMPLLFDPEMLTDTQDLCQWYLNLFVLVLETCWCVIKSNTICLANNVWRRRKKKKSNIISSCSVFKLAFFKYHKSSKGHPTKTAREGSDGTFHTSETFWSPGWGTYPLKTGCIIYFAANREHTCKQGSYRSNVKRWSNLAVLSLLCLDFCVVFPFAGDKASGKLTAVLSSCSGKYDKSVFAALSMLFGLYLGFL